MQNATNQKKKNHQRENKQTHTKPKQNQQRKKNHNQTHTQNPSVFLVFQDISGYCASLRHVTPKLSQISRLISHETLFYLGKFIPQNKLQLCGITNEIESI